NKYGKTVAQVSKAATPEALHASCRQFWAHRDRTEVLLMPLTQATSTTTRNISVERLRELAALMLQRYKVDARGESPHTTLVFVLGAEASRASCLKDWKRFGEDLVGALSGHYKQKDDDAFLDDALTRLQPLIGPAPADHSKREAFLKEKAKPEL